MNLLYCFDDNRNPEYIQILSGRNSIEENRVIGYYCLMTDRRSKTNKKFMLLSAIGIFMVVDSHTWTALNIFGDFIPYNSFFMPMFVFISGYFNKVDSSTKLWDYTRKKLKTLILPYALISLFVFGIQWLMNFYKLGESVPPPSGYLAYVLEHVCTTGVSLYICEPMWFVITLFALLMIYAIIKKLLAMHWNSFVALAVFTALHLASLHVVTTLEYEEFYYFLLPLKCMFFLPFLELGIIYRNHLEEKHQSISGGKKIGILVLMLLLNTIRTLYLPNPYDIAFENLPEMAGFTSPYIVTPMISSIIGILFWLTLVDLLGKPLQESRFVNYMSCNTFCIMGLHITFFNILNCILMAINEYIVALPYFDVEYFQESEWYRWEPTYHVKFLYVVIGILGPLGVKWLWDKGTSLIAQGFKNCDVSSAAEERYP